MSNAGDNKIDNYYRINIISKRYISSKNPKDKVRSREQAQTSFLKQEVTTYVPDETF